MKIGVQQPVSYLLECKFSFAIVTFLIHLLGEGTVLDCASRNAVFMTPDEFFGQQSPLLLYFIPISK